MTTTYPTIALAAVLTLGCGSALKATGDAEDDTGTDVGDDTTTDGTDVPADSPGDTTDDTTTDGADVPADTTGDTMPDATDVPVDGGCSPGESRCSPDGTSLETCDPSGTGWSSLECEYGCGDDPEPHCLEWAVSNIPDPVLLTAGEPPAAEDPPLDNTSYYWVDFNTDDGSVVIWELTSESWDHVMDWRPAEAGEGLHAESGIHFAVVSQGEGHPELGVFSFQNLEIPANQTWGVWGTRALVLVSEEDAVVEGGVYAGCLWYDGPALGGASSSSEGPGAGGDGTSVGVPGGNRDGGGGGGGFGGTGGTGGGYDPGLRGDGGAPYGPSTLVPLLGGSGGGNGGGDGWGRWGGRSGGAIEIVSLGNLHVTGTGWVDVGGCGGIAASSNEGGGGGGSGGGILLESPSLTVEGAITANGGGGAGGEGSDGDAQDGEDGYYGSDAPAQGGVTTSPYGCDGADGNGGGGVDGESAPPCDSDPDLSFNAGGGGGAGGRLRFNGMTRSITGIVSPGLGSPAATEDLLPLI